ncbi:hypothetical protein FRB96_005754 [Tulasnella sp. 330]|nr:hypothetical protein FRB96_005754 [Tulasnella sp. 330]KAG8876530.1 hypothetical protein FRB98_007253 [Tulasnella sp. 332]KAG8881157.1 hypothetical protein FRB97_009853 [Tulasnella sp. 331]
MSADSKLFQTITTDNIKSALGALRPQTFFIITAESGFCPACHSDLSSANITAPNSLLGHLRRSKKCIQKREEKNIKLFGLKQPESLLWGSVDDIMALDGGRFPEKHIWAQAVFPPTRPQLGAPPMYSSPSQWNVRGNDGYSSSSPPPSSGSSDDGWSGSTASSSSGSSPTASQFSQQYVMPSHPHGHPAQYALSYDPTIRRESNSTISAADYYAQKQAKMSAGLQQINAARSANNVNAAASQQYYTPSAPGMGIGAQYRGQAPQMYVPPQQQQQQQQQMQGMYAQQQYAQPGYQYPAPGSFAY